VFRILGRNLPQGACLGESNGAKFGTCGKWVDSVVRRPMRETEQRSANYFCTKRDSGRRRGKRRRARFGSDKHRIVVVPLVRLSLSKMTGDLLSHPHGLHNENCHLQTTYSITIALSSLQRLIASRRLPLCDPGHHPNKNNERRHFARCRRTAQDTPDSLLSLITDFPTIHGKLFGLRESTATVTLH
jgi:hypothetical protein